MRGGAVAGGRRRGRPADGASCSRRAGLRVVCVSQLTQLERTWEGVHVWRRGGTPCQDRGTRLTTVRAEGQG